MRQCRRRYAPKRPKGSRAQWRMGRGWQVRSEQRAGRVRNCNSRPHHRHLFLLYLAAAVTTTSMSHLSFASDAWTVARGGVLPTTTHLSLQRRTNDYLSLRAAGRAQALGARAHQTAFIDGKSLMSLRKIWPPVRENAMSESSCAETVRRCCRLRRPRAGPAGNTVCFARAGHWRVTRFHAHHEFARGGAALVAPRARLSHKDTRLVAPGQGKEAVHLGKDLSGLPGDVLLGIVGHLCVDLRRIRCTQPPFPAKQGA